MDRFPRRQFTGRSPGPPASAAADGLAQGTCYTAIVQAVAVNGECAVTIPALHLSETFSAHVASVTPTIGEAVLVMFDEQKRPWIVAGGANTAAEAKIAALEAKQADSGWKEPTLLNSWKNEPAGRAKTAYRKIGNKVMFRGSLFGGALGSEAFLLIEGFRPPFDLFPAGGGFSTVGAPCSVLISKSGTVNIYQASGSTQASLDGIEFTID